MLTSCLILLEAKITSCFSKFEYICDLNGRYIRNALPLLIVINEFNVGIIQICKQL